MWPWVKSTTFRAGQRGQQHFQLGQDPKAVGTSNAVQYGCVRAGFPDDQQPAENFTGYVVLPDNGTRIGPIDLPFELMVPLPVRVEVQPDVNLTATAQVVASVAYPASKHRWAATRRAIVPAATVPSTPITIPLWVHSIGICKVDATITLFDALGNVLCSFFGPVYDVPRPRAAVLIATVDAEPVGILYSYQA